MTATGGTNWKKAKFYNADSGQEVVECHFNPNEFTISKSNQWQTTKASGSGLPDVTFGGMGARTLQMTLIFDGYPKQKDVREDTEKLLGLTNVPEGNPSSGKSQRPPHVEFGWGNFRSFRAVITQVSQKFTLFSADGTPLRATLQVTLQEVTKETAKKQQKGANPTSRAIGSRKVRIVQPGDTIDWLAADELGDPTAWRLLAETNNLDDPRRLRPGQVLFIPAD